MKLGERPPEGRLRCRMTESEEDAPTIRLVAERLMQAHPHLDDGLVQGSVRTAYEELRYARVRTYLPVLMERRAKDLLASNERDERDA
ncbi:three-helix bundle dimerization domain-containing protein [Streptomyces gardneri]|uniref:three-helix bundle dimerization domain-containing protein n=1 Tax=Streptomyces gardneri TaxID=66892 RepID=UPI0037CCEF22